MKALKEQIKKMINSKEKNNQTIIDNNEVREKAGLGLVRVSVARRRGIRERREDLRGHFAEITSPVVSLPPSPL